MAPNVKRSKRTKARKRCIKKIKEMIGQDLVQDNVGTNQLLQYNQLIAILAPDIQYDTQRYNRYICNLEDQQRNQQYNRDPDEQYQLKKASKKLYNELKSSLFKNEPPVPVVILGMLSREAPLHRWLAHLSFVPPNNSRHHPLKYKPHLCGIPIVMCMMN